MPAKKISSNVARVVEMQQYHGPHQSSEPFQVFYQTRIPMISYLLVMNITAAFIRIAAVVALFSIRMRRALLQIETTDE